MATALFSDVCWIIRRLRSETYTAFIVGGAVRDTLLGRIPEDYDIATTATPEVIASLFPRTKPVGSAFGTTLVIIEHRPYQITTLQASGGTYTDVIEQDIRRRDFTVNALFWNPLEDRLIDLTGGMRDLKDRRLRPVTSAENIFEDDPVRMLRAIRLAHSLGFSLDPSILPAIRALRHKIARVSPERVQYELLKIFSLPQAFDALCPLARTRLLFEIIPELAPLSRLKQTPYHDFSALSHTFRTLRAVESLLSSPLFRDLAVHPGKHVLMMSALLHDIGKPETHTVESGRHHFYEHEKTGAVMAQAILRWLRFPKKDITMVTKLVANHLYPLHLFRHYREGTLSQKALDKFHRRVKRFLNPLLLLSFADQVAKHRGNSPTLSPDWLAFVDMVRVTRGRLPSGLGGKKGVPEGVPSPPGTERPV